MAQQLSKIDQRERALRLLDQRRARQCGHADVSELADDVGMSYNMPKNDNSPVNIFAFLHKNARDPAIDVSESHVSLPSGLMTWGCKGFLAKLQQHLHPRIQEMHAQCGGHIDAAVMEDPSMCVLIKNDTLYHHKLTRFNYTTYDVRRGSDLINPGTTKCNIMLLAHDGNDGEGDRSQRFLYARVLGIYHAKVIYTGHASKDYEARRVDFLWVRWYETDDVLPWSWASTKLPGVRFGPLTEEAAFGFVDPANVLRSCHIIPAFALGLRHPDGFGLSRCAKDSHDWHKYYIGW